MRLSLITLFGLALSACASTPKSDIAQIEPRAIIAQQSKTIDEAASIADARKIYGQGHYAQAIDLYKAVLLHNKNNNEAWLGLGNTALALGFTEEAHDAFLHVKPDDLQPHQKRALIASLTLLTTNTNTRIDEEGNLKSALKLAPKDARLWNALGRYYDQHSMWVESTESYVQAMKLSGSQGNTLNNLGMSLMMQGRYSEAQEKFVQAVATSPQSDIFDNNRRMSLIMLGDFKKASQNLTADRAALLYNDAGYIAMTQGREAQAHTLLSKAIYISPVYHVKAYANLKALEQSTR